MLMITATVKHCSVHFAFALLVLVLAKKKDTTAGLCLLLCLVMVVQLLFERFSEWLVIKYHFLFSLFRIYIGKRLAASTTSTL